MTQYSTRSHSDDFEIVVDDIYQEQTDLFSSIEETKSVENLHPLPEIRHQTLNFDSKLIEVCVYGKNFRHTSLFRHNLINKYGSGKFTFKVSNTTVCKKTDYSIFMVHFVKCCVSKLDAKKLIKKGIATHDVTIVTGDEYCLLKASLPHYRQYFTSTVGYISTRPMTLTSTFSQEISVDQELRVPLYFPLGPRTEFTLIEPFEVKSITSRQYLFNFIGSLSSPSRKLLNISLSSFSNQDRDTKLPFFLHTTDRWRRDLTEENGYISPLKYRDILIDSIFTLCPYGHNPEAYRIYEACQAGSIPILIKDDIDYNNHRCQNSYQPFIDSKAPFIWLNNWDELYPFLISIQNNHEELEEMSLKVQSWYIDFMTKFSLQFEQILQWRHTKRLHKHINKNIN